MRKVIYSVGASLDGYIADSNGSVEWLERAASKAKGEDFGMTSFFKSIDTVLMGRKTYEHALTMGMAKGGYPGMKNYIFSRPLPSGERDGVEFVDCSVAELVRVLRRKTGKHIWLCGGGELAREALAAGVVDEITLGVAPILIGAGRPTFPAAFPETVVELVKCKRYKGEFLGLTYRVDRTSGLSKPKKRAVKRPGR